MQTGLSSSLKVRGLEGTETIVLLAHVYVKASVFPCVKQAWLLLR